MSAPVMSAPLGFSGGSPTVHRGSGSSARNSRRHRRQHIISAPPFPVPGDLLDGFLLEEAIGVGEWGRFIGLWTPSSIARSR